VNKYYYKFLKINKRIVKNFNHSNKYIFLIDRGRFWHAFTSAVAAAALSKKYKSNVLIFSDKKNESEIVKFYKSFGFENFNFGLSYKFLISKLILFINSIILTLKTIVNIKLKGLTWFIKEFKVENINIGDLIYDEYIRFNHSYLNPKVDVKFIKILLVSIIKTKNFIQLMKKYKPKLIFVSTSGKSGNTGISIRVGVHKKIKVIELSANTKKINNYIIHDFSRIFYGKNRILQKKKGFKEFQKYTKNFNNKKLDKFINDRFKALNKIVNDKSKNKLILNATSIPGAGNMINFKGDRSNFLFSRNELIKKFTSNKSIITKLIFIAPHAFSDSPHDAGLDMIFDDYYSHFKETLFFINNNIYNKNILWLVKPHPVSGHYKENGIVERLVKKMNNKNIILCPKNISSHNLTLTCDHAVTARGSVGLEFACQGKYSITAAFAAYSKLGICLEPKNKNQYFSYLQNIANLPKLNSKQTLKAKKILYFLETKEQDNRLKNSIIYSEFIGNSEKTFFNKKLINNYEKINSFENDPYYKDIANKFII
jgi:hypothetical protein